ncbi:hypothetical protein PJP14_29790, partial [Mycobacterium kansasii]
SGLGYDKSIPPKHKNTPLKFVKGESSNSKGKSLNQNYPKNAKTFQTLKPKSNHINYKNQNYNPLAEKIVDLLKELLKCNPVG